MTDFQRWWLSLPEDLRVMFGSQAIGPAEEAFLAGQKAEREACAEIADEYEYQLVAGSCARDIRARGDE